MRKTQMRRSTSEQNIDFSPEKEKLVYKSNFCFFLFLSVSNAITKEKIVCPSHAAVEGKNVSTKFINNTARGT